MQPVCLSILLSFRPHLEAFVEYNVTCVAFVRFGSTLQHTLIVRHCMFGRKKGAEGIARVMPICNLAWSKSKSVLQKNNFLISQPKHML